MYNIVDFGAKNDGITNSTEAVRAAVTECVKDGGGVVYIPNGTYVLASVQVFSNVHFDYLFFCVFNDFPEYLIVNVFSFFPLLFNLSYDFNKFIIADFKFAFVEFCPDCTAS